ELLRTNPPVDGPEWLGLFIAAAQRLETQNLIPEAARRINLKALRLSVTELLARYPASYRNGQTYLAQIEALAGELAAAGSNGTALAALTPKWTALQRQALIVDNPLLDFGKLLVVKREGGKLGLPANWQGNSSMGPAMENEIAMLDLKTAAAPLATVYKPAKPLFVGDLNLHFDGQRLLFSSVAENGRWQVFEIAADGTGHRQVTPPTPGDVDNYNGIYLPDGRIIFDSSATFVGVPCVGGADYVGNLHLLSADGKSVRRLCYDQDNDWYPTLMPDGRVMFLRWEYTDSAHYFSRVLMTMNPDGTGQLEHYGSNSYWPNAMFYAKPLPGAPTKFVAIVSGHHGVPRMGELVVFDVSKGRQEVSGAVQRIPGRGKAVRDVIRDCLVDGSWPKFLHPTPLSENYFLVSCQPRPQDPWGVYLADTFDNLVLIREEPGFALLEPTPLRATRPPPAIPDRIQPDSKTATVSIQDIYVGRGLRGVPRGSVKALRLFQYEYSYRNMGGHYTVGIEGPWDVRRIIGTVPVTPEGAAYFEIPANTPVTLQPLDAEGKALQQLRSWFVGMPGEHVSCTGCHDPQNSTVPFRSLRATRSGPAKPTPWYGPRRGFSFVREVQPVLDKYCAGCHDGKTAGRPNLADASLIGTSIAGRQPRSYVDLHPFVRRNGPEGDYTGLTPLEFHADTSELIQMLAKGHHNVKLDQEAWDRLITWIDLNVPSYGTWNEISQIPANFKDRRREMKLHWSGIDEDIEEIINPYTKTTAFVAPAPLPPKPAAVVVPGWPFTADQAAQMPAADGRQPEMSVDLGGGRLMRFRRIPAGAYEMGDLNGAPDEYPTAKVTIANPFWLAETEVSLQQYQLFNSAHRNGYYDMHYKDQVRPGYLMDFPNLPVIRVSWQEAAAFCQWLAQKTGKRVTLPSEAQWEWACRAGSSTPLSYGGLDTDFATQANLGDKSLSLLAVIGVDPQPLQNPDKFWDFIPKDARFNDGVVHLAEVNAYAANAWGLKNMHGNVAEWTRSSYLPYPYDPALAEKTATSGVRMTVRGGSWADRPKNARAASRQNYPSWMKVYNVGFRVMIED
ncbi:MAG: SUMF1/EgtB/PvdO family nonheme iron enzyme, partial [bacterium]